MLDHNPLARAVEGGRYEAMAPDTLDLADRMGLATNALTNVWLPEEKWGLGFVVELEFLGARERLDSYPIESLIRY